MQPTLLTRLDAWSDGLSPILVKEVRQGLKANGFTIVFLFFLAFLTINAIPRLLKGYSYDQDWNDGFFWFIVYVPLVGLLPISASGMVNKERSERTMELVLLSKLSAWRVIFGKWCSVAVRALLLMAAVLPFLVLRYFSGGVDVVGEVLRLALALAACLGLSALSLAGSAARFSLFRVVGTASVVIGGFWSFGLIVELEPYFTAAWLYGALMYLLTVLFFLIQAAGMLAAQAESYVRWRRLLGVVLAAVTVWGFGEWPYLAWVGLPLLAILAVQALTEPAVVLPAHVRPFRRWGAAGRLVGRLLFYPGWASGWVYVTVLGLGSMWAFLPGLVTMGADPDDVQNFWVLAVSALIFPVAVTRLFVPRSEHSVVVYGVVQAVQLLLGSLLLAVINLGTFFDDFAMISAPFPTVAWMLVGEWGYGSAMLGLHQVFLVVYVVILLWRSGPIWRAQGRLEAEVAASEKGLRQTALVGATPTGAGPASASAGPASGAVESPSAELSTPVPTDGEGEILQGGRPRP